MVVFLGLKVRSLGVVPGPGTVYLVLHTVEKLQTGFSCWYGKELSLPVRRSIARMELLKIRSR